MFGEALLDIQPLGNASFPDERIKAWQELTRSSLTKLEQRFSAAEKSKTKPSFANLLFLPLGDGNGLAAADAPRAQELYLRTWQAGAKGTANVQKSLLTLLAAAEDERSIPFWMTVVDLHRKNDALASLRHTLAASALARLVVHKQNSDALNALLALTQHANAQVRANAAQYLTAVYLVQDAPPPANVIDQLTALGTSDAEFLPRFVARSALNELHLPVPTDENVGVYEFKVNLIGDDSFHCVLAALPDNTLEDLHWAIQSALDWDDDHLYAFYMNHAAHDELYAIVDSRSDGEQYAQDTHLGELGLTLNHRFLYLFDYGDMHEFQVTVTAIHPAAYPLTAALEDYPILVSSAGEPPDQYPDMDDEAWDVDWDEAAVLNLEQNRINWGQINKGARRPQV